MRLHVFTDMKISHATVEQKKELSRAFCIYFKERWPDCNISCLVNGTGHITVGMTQEIYSDHESDVKQIILGKIHNSLTTVDVDSLIDENDLLLNGHINMRINRLKDD